MGLWSDGFSHDLHYLQSVPGNERQALLVGCGGFVRELTFASPLFERDPVHHRDRSRLERYELPSREYPGLPGTTRCRKRVPPRSRDAGPYRKPTRIVLPHCRPRTPLPPLRIPAAQTQSTRELAGRRNGFADCSPAGGWLRWNPRRLEEPTAGRQAGPKESPQ